MIGELNKKGVLCTVVTELALGICLSSSSKHDGSAVIVVSQASAGRCCKPVFTGYAEARCATV